MLPLKIISERHTEIGLKNKLEAEVRHDVATGGKKMLRSWAFKKERNWSNEFWKI